VAPGQELDRVELQESIERTGHVAVDVKEALGAEPVVRVYLGVPKLRLGRANDASEFSAEHCRYTETKREFPDEVAGGNDQEISLRELNAKILLSTQDRSGYETIPIAQIKRAGDREATPQLDDDYIPPVLAMEAWSPLALEYLRAIYDVIGQKVRILSEQVLSRGITPTSQEPGDMDRMIMLMILNEAHASLRCLSFSSGLHPFVAYTELCRIVGKLSIFSPERRSAEIPVYDHDDLARIFKWVKQQIALLINQIRDYAYEREDFRGVANRMQVALKAKWLGPEWDWYVGVNFGDSTKETCKRLLSQGVLDWKLGSSQEVDRLFSDRAAGLMPRVADTPPRALPAKGPWVFYQVIKTGRPWISVEATKTLAFRFSDSLIKNLAELPGQQKLVVQERHSKEEVTLQFALFALDLRNI
jgi:type VI secretion system protein ImpJ